MQATNLGGAQAVTPRPLGRSDYKTLGLAALGGALEFYDFIIFVFFAPAIGQLFFPAAMPDWLRQVQTFGIFAAGYLARPLGGIIMAHFGDLFGRKRMFTLSVLLMSVPTLMMGLLPTYASIGVLAPVLLLLLRVMQGAAVGGEVPGAWVFVSEHVPQRHIGYACGTLTAGLTAGILLGSLIASAINRHFAPAEISAYAWRIPFLLGGVFGMFSVYLRRWLHETPVFAELQAAQGDGRRSAAQGRAARPRPRRDRVDAADVDAVGRDRRGDPDDADAAAKAVSYRAGHRAAGEQRGDAVPDDRLRDGGLDCRAHRRGAHDFHRRPRAGGDVLRDVPATRRRHLGAGAAVCAWPGCSSA